MINVLASNSLLRVCYSVARVCRQEPAAGIRMSEE